jgi:PAS domain S-box-containing protein
VNKSGLDQFGYSDQDLVKGLRAYDIFAEEERARLEKNVRSILAGRGTRLKEYRAQHKDGSCFPTLVSSSPIRKKDQVTGIRGFVIDISDKKNLEERLRQANRMEAIGNLAAGVAHDLNNILSGLVGYPDLLLLDLPAGSPMRPPVEVIKNTGQKAAAVVQDLLSLARRNLSELQVVSLNDIVEDYLTSPEFLKLKEQRTEIHLAANLSNDLMYIMASNHHIFKGLMNLVVNAIEAMPAGGRLKVQTANCYVDRILEGYEDIPEGEYAVLSVIDSGIGISSEDIKNIFEPFYTKKRMGRSGTGLGMSVVWATVKDHGGFVNIQSREGSGTRFDLYFPVTREKIAPKPSHIPIEDYLGSEQILVVDDIAEQRRIAADMLERLGYKVHTVSSGEAALEVVREKTIDLVILDMVMDPGIDGLETYQRILELVPQQKAIIASGFAETERVRAVLKLGANSYLKKPYTLEKLGLSVRAALDSGGSDG